jgi:hypothetical protein
MNLNSHNLYQPHEFNICVNDDRLDSLLPERKHLFQTFKAFQIKEIEMFEIPTSTALEANPALFDRLELENAKGQTHETNQNFGLSFLKL